MMRYCLIGTRMGRPRVGGVALCLAVLFMTGPLRADTPGITPPPAEVLAPQEVWAVMSGSSLKGTMEGWARASGWTIVWDNPVDYRIRVSATFQGDFEMAVARLVDAIHQGSPELNVTLYRGNRVLHVEDPSRSGG